MYSNGSIDLINPLFESNVAAHETDGVGIATFGRAMVRCDEKIGCLAVCTVCPVHQRTPQPASSPQPTPSFAASRTGARKYTPVSLIVLLVVVAYTVIAVLLYTAQLRFYSGRIIGAQRRQDGVSGIQLAMHSDNDYMRLDPADETVSTPSVTSPDPRDMTIAPSATPSLPWAVMESSPAPIIVINCGMLITLWSVGMKLVAPLPIDPVVGRRFSELPFINEHAASSFGEVVHQMLSSEEEDQDTQSAVLYLRTVASALLLEMTATVVGTMSTRVVILTGRQMDPALAGLIGLYRQPIVSSHSGEGSKSETDISSLTMPTGCGDEAEASSLSRVEVTELTNGEVLGVPSLNNAVTYVELEYKEREWLAELAEHEAVSTNTSCLSSLDI